MFLFQDMSLSIGEEVDSFTNTVPLTLYSKLNSVFKVLERLYGYFIYILITPPPQPKFQTTLELLNAIWNIL